jgi:nicotinamidase-related amidase
MSDTSASSGSALLLLDIQSAVVPAFGGDEALLEDLQRLASSAREASVPVVYVRVAFRPGYPDVSDANALFGPLRDVMDLTEANPDTGIHPKVAPHEGDVIVTKRRVSAFTGSDLQLVLRSMGIRRLVLAGVATSQVVLSTVREAADLDYELVVLSDGCADGDAEVHGLLMEKVFPSQATVSTIDEWIGSL